MPFGSHLFASSFLCIFSHTMFHARIGVIWTYFLCPATTLPLQPNVDTIIPGGTMRSLGVHGKRGILREEIIACNYCVIAIILSCLLSQFRLYPILGLFQPLAIIRNNCYNSYVNKHYCKLLLLGG